MPKTVPIARLLLDVMLNHSECIASPLRTHATKPGSDQLGRGVEHEGKSHSHPQPQPGNAPHSDEARTKPVEDHLSAEGHHLGHHQQSCTVGLWLIITATALVLDDQLVHEKRKGGEQNKLCAARKVERNFFKS